MFEIDESFVYLDLLMSHTYFSGIDLNAVFQIGNFKEKFDYSDPVKAPHLVHRGASGGFVDYVLTKQEITIGRSKNNQTKN